MAIGSRRWFVNTKTCVWYGGVSPHQPFQSSLGHGPRIGPNILRPMIHEPIPSNPRAAKSSSTPPLPPSCPNIFLNVLVESAHLWRLVPPTPRGFSTLCCGPAPNPSAEIEKLSTRSLGITRSSDTDLQRYARLR